jgi:hypothetical protein
VNQVVGRWALEAHNLATAQGPVPRLRTPHRRIQSQTCVHAWAHPGAWHVLGRERAGAQPCRGEGRARLGRVGGAGGRLRGGGGRRARGAGGQCAMATAPAAGRPAAGTLSGAPDRAGSQASTAFRAAFQPGRACAHHRTSDRPHLGGVVRAAHVARAVEGRRRQLAARELYRLRPQQALGVAVETRGRRPIG